MKNCELINGTEVSVSYTATQYRPATWKSPEEGGFEELTKVLWTSPNNVTVDILPLLNEQEYEYIVDQIMDKEDDDY